MSGAIKVEFTGVPIKCVCNYPNFKVYAFDVDLKKFKDVRANKYGNVSVSGNVGELSIGTKYTIVGEEQNTKYGAGYNAVNVKREKPMGKSDVYSFLCEILTPNQTKVICDTYPDIIDRVQDDKLFSEIDVSRLHGIGEYTLNVIRNKIVENFYLSDIISEFGGLLSFSVIKKLYDKYSSIEKLKEKLQEDPYKCLCGISGIGFKTADVILQGIESASKERVKNGEQPIIKFDGDLKTSPQRCLSCLIYLLKENEKNGHTKMNLADLRAQCIKTTPECADCFTTVIKSDNIYYNKETMDVALQKTYDVECKIAKTVLNNIKCDEEDIWRNDIEKYRNLGEYTLSDEQMRVLSYICKFKIVILNGFAGSGKTASTNAVIKMLKDNNKNFKLFSPTGKAAKVISEYTGESASTIHRGLQYKPDNEWFYCEDNKLECDMLIIDEFSMVDIFLFEKVIDAIDFSKTRLLLIGDDAQLPSVGCGNILHDFIESKIIPTVTLTKIFRYNDGGLMKIATDVRCCSPYLNSSMKNKATPFGNKDYTFVDVPSDKIPDNVIALYKRLLDKGYSVSDIEVLTAKNVGDCGTIVLNNMIQKIANQNFGCDTYLKVGDTVYYVGDLIIQKENNYKAELDIDHCNEYEKERYEKTGEAPTAFVANGETGTIISISGSCAIIDFGGIYIKYDASGMSTVGLGYCITIHKSQGSSSKIVILATPKSHIFMLNSNLIYVGLTRMKEMCYHIGSVQTVNQAVVKKANLERNTMMKQLLLK